MLTISERSLPIHEAMILEASAQGVQDAEEMVQGASQSVWVCGRLIEACEGHQVGSPSSWPRPCVGWGRANV